MSVHREPPKSWPPEQQQKWLVIDLLSWNGSRAALVWDRVEQRAVSAAPEAGQRTDDTPSGGGPA